MIRVFSLLFFSIFIIYSIVIFNDRNANSQISSDVCLTYAEDLWGVKPKPTFESLIIKNLGDDTMVQILGFYYYLFQAPVILERIYTLPSFNLMYSLYHIDILAAAGRFLPPIANYMDVNYRHLTDANIYGFFSGVWGSLFLDYGYLFIPLSFIWGRIVAIFEFRSFARKNLYDILLFVFLFNTVIVSFVSAPLGTSNSFCIFIWVLFAYYHLKNLRIKVTKKISPVVVNHSCHQ